jgi:hypothetical protein
VKYRIEYHDTESMQDFWYIQEGSYPSKDEAKRAIRDLMALGGPWLDRAYRVGSFQSTALTHTELVRMAARLDSDGALVGLWFGEEGEEAVLFNEDEIAAAVPGGPVRSGWRFGRPIHEAVRELVARDLEAVAREREHAAELERERAAAAQERERMAAQERERVAAQQRVAAQERERVAKQAREHAAADAAQQHAAAQERERAAAVEEQQRAAAQARERAAAREREVVAAEAHLRAVAHERERAVAQERERVAAVEAQQRAAALERERAAALEAQQRAAALECERVATQARERAVEREREREQEHAGALERERVATQTRARAAALERERVAAQEAQQRAAVQERERAAALEAQQRAAALERERAAAQERERAAALARKSEATTVPIPRPVATPPIAAVGRPAFSARLAQAPVLGGEGELDALAKLLRCGPWPQGMKACDLITPDLLPAGAHAALQELAGTATLNVRALGNALKRVQDKRIEGIPRKITRTIDNHGFAIWQVANDLDEASTTTDRPGNGELLRGALTGMGYGAADANHVVAALRARLDTESLTALVREALGVLALRPTSASKPKRR